MLSLILAAALVSSPGNQIFPVVHQLRDDIRLVQLSPETAVEQMTGQAAKLHIRNLMSRQPQAFAASRSLLTERGYVPTDHFYVERTINLAGKKRDKGDIQFANSESNADGEIDIALQLNRRRDGPFASDPRPGIRLAGAKWPRRRRTRRTSAGIGAAADCTCRTMLAPVRRSTG